MKSWMKWVVGVFLLAVGGTLARAEQVGPKLQVKFIVVTDLDTTAKHGHPGLFQAWVSGEHFDTSFTVPGMDHPVRSDGRGSLAVLVGTGDQAVIQLLALGADDRFDLTHAYWLVTGIGSANPDQLSLGGVAWATRLVSGDTGFEMDRADAPPDWPYGIVPLDVSDVPADYPAPSRKDPSHMMYKFNLALTKMAYVLSKDVKLPDLPAVVKYRSTFPGYQGAMRPPLILAGSLVGTSRVWRGKVLNQWATDWVQYWSKGGDPFLLGDTADQSIMAALTAMSKRGQVNLQRVLIERSAWNYTVPPPNQLKDQSLADDFPGMGLAAANAFLAARPIFHEITGHWARYADETPQ